MQSNLYSLILAAVGNYSWHESSHPFVTQDKNLYLYLLSISLYISIAPYLFFLSTFRIFLAKKGDRGTN